MRTSSSQPGQAEEEIPLSQNRNQTMRSESLYDLSMDVDHGALASIKAFKNKVIQANKRFSLPTVLSNGEILANLIVNESDMEE